MVSLTDQGVLFAKNSDRDPSEAQHLDWVPATEHRPGDQLRCTWITIPQVPRTHAVLLSRPWWMWGAEMGANEHGVVIGNEAVFTRAPREDGDGLLGMDLLRLALERADSAERAVEVIVSLLERYGQGGSCSRVHPRFSYDNSFLVADPSGAIVLETAGREWATERVRGAARAISNGLTIAGFAATRGDRLRTAVAACNSRAGITRRRSRLAHEPSDLMAVLRDHGGADPSYSPLNGAMSAPCMHAGGGLLTNSQTTASWVSDLRDDPLHWVTGTAAPCTSTFKPVTVDQPVHSGPAPGARYDPRSLWWRHERLHRAVMGDPGARLARYSEERDRLERSWLLEPPSGQAAFDHAATLEAEWLRDVVAAGSADLRPRAVRRYWRREDRRSGVPSPNHPVESPLESGQAVR
jgi:secernin